jgi:hypothetical protein
VSTFVISHPSSPCPQISPEPTPKKAKVGGRGEMKSHITSNHEQHTYLLLPRELERDEGGEEWNNSTKSHHRLQSIHLLFPFVAEWSKRGKERGNPKERGNAISSFL